MTEQERIAAGLCWLADCERPENLDNHYHCGNCNSPKPTSMFGHYTEHGFTCTAPVGGAS